MFTKKQQEANNQVVSHYIDSHYIKDADQNQPTVVQMNKSYQQQRRKTTNQQDTLNQSEDHHGVTPLDMNLESQINANYKFDTELSPENMIEENGTI